MTVSLEHKQRMLRHLEGQAMANRWIVSRYRFHEHKSLEAAQAELKRLTESTGKKYRMYRVKTVLEPDEGETMNGEQG